MEFTETHANQPNILVVDDDDVLRSRLTRAFLERGFLATGAANCEEAMQVARQDPPELAVVDLKMPGCSGLDLVTTLLELDPQTKIVVLTGYGSIASAIDAIRIGATHYLAKPADADEILAAFEKGEGTAGSHDNDSYEPPSLARTEWEHIQRVLADCGGNISEAARRLKIHRRSLQRKLRKFAPPA
jgi:two-component system response regulator RegA